jgi:FkbM family methyltransferase
MIKFIKSVFHSFGVQLSRYRADMTEDAMFIKMLNKHGIDHVFDVGANKGQFGSILRDAGYRGQIISFEPLSDAYQKLIALSAKDPLWKVAPRMAIGNEDGEITINIASNSESSSVLDMLEAHSNAAKDSVYIGTEQVPVHKLDTVAGEYTASNARVFLKIDTQGYEDQVLSGASFLLEKAVGIQLELSLVPLYEGQQLYESMIAKMKEKGFELWSITPVFKDRESGRLLQVDGTFFRKP